MEIEYSLNPQDFQELSRYHRQLRSVQTQLSFRAILSVAIIVAVIIPGLGFLLPTFVFGDEVLLASMMSCYGGFFGALLLLIWRQAWLNRASLKAVWDDPRSDWAVRGVRVVLSSNQLCTVARGVTSMYEWSRFWHIGETDKHVFLFYSRNSAIIVPRRVFHDDQHFQEFIGLARQYRQERGQPAPKATGIITSLPPRADAITRKERA